MNETRPKLTFFYPGWYAIVMGLCGLALAWHRATPLMGEMASGVALVLGALASCVFAVLAVATLRPGQRTCATRCATPSWPPCRLR